MNISNESVAEGFSDCFRKNTKSFERSSGVNMLLQGNLQNVFDALYTLGAIDPVLKMDWQKMNKEFDDHMDRVYDSFRTINKYSDDFTILLKEMEKMDSKTLQYLAMEVAREFCEYQDRSSLH